MENPTKVDTPTTTNNESLPADMGAETALDAGDDAVSPGWAEAVASVEKDEALPDMFEAADGADESAESGDDGSQVDSEVDNQQDDKKAESPSSEWESKFKAQESQIAEMKALLAQALREKESKAESAPAEQPKKVSLSKEAQELLEFTPALKEVIEMQARQIAEEMANGLKKETKSETLLAQQHQEESRLESQYQGQIGSWFQSEFPDLKLDEVRTNPDYSDWLESRKNWVKDTMKKHGRFEISGEQAVLKRFLVENYPNRAQAGEKRQADNSRRLAAAKLPSGTPTRSPSTRPTNSWAEAVKQVMGDGRDDLI